MSKKKTPKQNLKEMVHGLVTNNMLSMGDSKMTPEIQVFMFRGIPSRELLAAVASIIDALVAGGVDLPEDRNTIINKIVADIRKTCRTPM